MSITATLFASGFAAVAQPAQTAVPSPAPAPSAVAPTTVAPAPAVVSPTPFLPNPLPSNVATPSALFANKAYFYRGEDNDPEKHPVPPEVQLGFKRDNHIYCLDWYRMLRTSHNNDWSYYVTTCQCYPEFILRSFGKGKG